MIEPAAASSLLPPSVRQHRVRFDVSSVTEAHPWLASLAVPPALAGAAPARRLEFLVGRACAREAMRALSPELVAFAIPIGADRGPRWPDGVVGAITHGAGLVAAAVGSPSEVRGLGIDCERVVDAGAMDAVLETALPHAPERDVATRAGLDPRVACTVVFSAKESVYKALRTRAGRPIDFGDLELVELEREGRCRVLARGPLAKWSRPDDFLVRFSVDGDVVETAIALPSDSPTATHLRTEPVSPKSTASPRRR
jgi:enterobactin synthetase component D